METTIGHASSYIFNNSTWCAAEGNYCDCKGKLIYTPELTHGFSIFKNKERIDIYVTKETHGLTACSNSVFGDPAIGKGKVCFCDGIVTSMQFNQKTPEIDG